MSSRVLRITPGSVSGGVQRIDANGGMRLVLLAAQSEPVPVVLVVSANEYDPCGDGHALLEDRGSLHRAHQPHNTLPGRKTMQLLRVGFTQRKRFLKAVAQLVDRAMQLGDTNVFVLVVSPVLFAELWLESASEDAPLSLALTAARSNRTMYQRLLKLIPAIAIPPGVSDAFRGKSESAVVVQQFIVLAARNANVVLLSGETGTGKGVAARAIHDQSGRRGPFMHVNCAGIPRDLFEAELFGAVKGAFTGAIATRAGLWLAADHGTLFLDEIGELTPDHQARILTAIESNLIRRVGGVESIKTDVRIITATNRDLLDMVAAGTFRSDLYFRLRCLDLELPPLREHLQDLPILVDHFWRTLTGKDYEPLSAEVQRALAEYHWPGNGRDLLGALSTLFAIVGPKGLKREHVRAWIETSALAGAGGRGASLALSAMKQYGEECVRHLRHTDATLRQAQLPLREVMGGAPATPDVRNRIASATMMQVMELERLCETTVLFHGAFEVVRAVKNKLRTFANMLPEQPGQALAYWRSAIEPAFAEAFATILRSIDELIALDRKRDSGDRQRRPRPPRKKKTPLQGTLPVSS